MFKTVISRYTNVKAGKFVASVEDQQSSDYNEDEYESLNDIETVLDATGIKIRENAKEFRDFEDVLEEIASKWDGFDQTTQNAIGTALFGTRQREIGLTVLQNWSQVGKYEDIAANAYGTAEKKMEAFTDSVEAAKNRVTVAVEEWAIALNGGDTIKNFYNMIAFLIRNLNTLGIGILGLTLILNRNNLATGAGKFANNILRQITSLGSFAKSTMRGNLAGALSNGEMGSPEMVVNNPTGLGLNSWQVDYLNGVQEEYAKTLSGYTTTLNESQKQQMIALQNNLLADSAVKANTFATVLRQQTTIKNMNTEQLHLVAEKMLILAKDKEEQTLWENIAKLEAEQVSSEDLARAQKAYAEKLQSGAIQQAAENADEFHGQGRYEVKDRAKQTQSLGIASMGFSIAGTMIGSSVGSQFGETGTIIGSLIGSTAGPVLGKVMIEKASAYLASGSAVGALAKLAGFVTNPIGAAVLAVFTVGAAIGITKALNSSKKKLEALAQEFTDQSNKYTEYKSTLVTAEKYDDLAKGVDQLGRNLTLTDDEYKQFLDYSNQLAETFPEMVQYIDEAGNKLLGYGGKVGQVSSAIEQLVEQQKRATNQALLQKDLFKQSYGEAYEEFSEVNKEKKQKQSDLQKFELYRNLTKRVGNEIVFGTDEQRAIFERIFNSYSKDIKANTAHGEHNKLVFDVWNPEDFKEIDKAIENVNNQLKSDIQELDTTMSNARQGLSDQVNAILDEMKYDSKYKTLFAGMTDEMKQIVQLTVSNVPFVEGESDEDFIVRLEDTIAQIAQFVNDNPIYLDFMLAPDGGMGAQEYEKTRQDMLKALMQVFGVDNVEDLSDGQIKVLATFGFKLDDSGNLIDGNDVLAQFKAEGLDKYLGFDLSNSKYKYSVDEIKQITQILQENPSYYKTEDDLFDKVIASEYKGMSTTEIAKQYKNFKSFENSLTDEEKKRYEVIKKTMDLWAERLGAVKGNYDQIAEKAEQLGDLGMFGESTKTPNEIIDQVKQYKEWYSYMKNDYKGTWDAETLANMAEDSNLVPLLGDPKKLTAKLREYIDNADLLYDKAMVNIMGSSEEGWKYILSINANVVNKFKENYNIDLSNYKTLQEAEADIKAKYDSAMLTSTADWVSQMMILYAEDISNFGTATQKKMQMLAAVYSSMTGVTNSVASTIVGQGIGDLTQEIYNDKISGKNLTDAEKTKLWQESTQEALDTTTTNMQKEQAKNTYDKIMAQFEEMTGNMKSGITTNFKDTSGSGSSSNKDATKDRWEALKKYYESIDKEWEAMLAFDENRDTEYFDKKRVAGLAEMAEINGLLDKQNALLKAGKLTSEDIAELEERRIALQKELNNLDDEEWEDRISILDTLDATLESQILAQEELLKTSDTEEERLERQQKLNDLIKQEYELRMNINEWEEKNAERAQKYLSGNAYSNAGQYDVFTNLRRQNIKANQEQAWNNYTQIIKQAEANLVLENKNGGKNWTHQEIYNKARETQEARDALDKYFEYVEQENDLINEAFEAKVDELDTRISELEKTKPEEWGHLKDIQPYYNKTINLIQAKISQIEEALSNTQGMTDEQIQAWVDKYNEAIQAFHDAQKNALEDITNYQSNQFNALTDWIEEYKQNIEDIKDATNNYYDDLIDKLGDYNEDLSRTNDLLAKQKQLADSLKEKQRVYREGIGWVFESPRDKVKQAQKDLDDFYRQDKIDDLNDTKDTEDKILQDKIDSLDLYLKALNWQYTEQERIERDRLLAELMNLDESMSNAEKQKAIHDNIISDWHEFNATCEGDYKHYDQMFGNFLDSYTNNMLKLYDLQRETLAIMNSIEKLGVNDAMSNLFKNISDTSSIANAVGMSEEDKAALAEYGRLWNEAFESKDADREKRMKYAHAGAEAIRAKYGYSGGDDGSAYLRKQKISSLEDFNKMLDQKYKKQQIIENIKAKNDNDNNITYKTSTGETKTISADLLADWVSQNDNLSVQYGLISDNFSNFLSKNADNIAAYQAQQERLQALANMNFALNGLPSGTITTSGGSYTPASGGGMKGDEAHSGTMSAADKAALAAAGNKYNNAKTQAEKDAAHKEAESIRDKYGYSGGKDGSLNISTKKPGSQDIKKYSGGLLGGPVTYTGLAMLHGSETKPEYVLNNDQAYNLLYNMSTSRLNRAEFESKFSGNSGDIYNLYGDINLEDCDNPAEFWDAVMNSASNRWQVTKNKK